MISIPSNGTAVRGCVKAAVATKLGEKQRQQQGMHEQQRDKDSRVVVTTAAAGGGEQAATGVCTMRKQATHMGGSSSTRGVGCPVERREHCE